MSLISTKNLVTTSRLINITIKDAMTEIATLQTKTILELITKKKIMSLISLTKNLMNPVTESAYNCMKRPIIIEVHTLPTTYKTGLARKSLRKQNTKSEIALKYSKGTTSTS